MKKTKGFTIIELIVVIAIIAILAAIVMVNVTQYITKAKDASIKADLKAIQTTAIMRVTDRHGITFEEDFYSSIFFPSNDFLLPEAAIDKINGSDEVYHSGLGDWYCVSSPLASNNAKHWCIDSNGVGNDYFGPGNCQGEECIIEVE